MKLSKIISKKNLLSATLVINRDKTVNARLFLSEVDGYLKRKPIIKLYSSLDVDIELRELPFNSILQQNGYNRYRDYHDGKFYVNVYNN